MLEDLLDGSKALLPTDPALGPAIAPPPAGGPLSPTDPQAPRAYGDPNGRELAPGNPNLRHESGAIKKVRYSHEAMADLIISNPMIQQGEIAKHFGYTQGWVSMVLASDAFKQHLETRKAELVDPVIRASIEERFKALVYRSIDVVMQKLEVNTVSADVALKGVELGAKALGYGGKQSGPAILQQFVAVVPQKAASTDEWLKSRAPAVLPPVVQVQEALDAPTSPQPATAPGTK